MDDFEKAHNVYKFFCKSSGQPYEKPSRMHSEIKLGILYLKTSTGSILGCYNISTGQLN
jgi:hypothetical protein